MKVLHISKYDCKGGAALAALNSVATQREIGIDAIMLAGRKLGNDPFVLGPTPIGDLVAVERYAIERLPARLAGLPKTDTRSVGWTGLKIRPILEIIRPDVVVLHNVDGVLRIEDLTRIGVPVIWRMHDAWPLLGTRHYCEGSVPRRFESLFDRLDGRVAYRKRKAMENMASLTFCPPSRWLGEMVTAARTGADVEVVANGIDTGLFSPVSERMASRLRLGFDESDFVVLFGAATGTADPRKGFDLLECALKKMSIGGAKRIKIATFGGYAGREPVCGFPAVHFGRVSDRAALAEIYGVADIAVVPSREENLSLTVIEALSCGTPVVAFDIGGMPDMICSGTNGWLVPAHDVKGLATAIVHASESGDELLAMRTAARETATNRFDRFVEARRMASLFERLLREGLKDPYGAPEREADDHPQE